MAAETKLQEWVGKDLSGFRIVEMTEVYKTNDDGRKIKSFGFFTDPRVATVFADTQTDANRHNTGPALILTNGTVGYVLTDSLPVTLFEEGAVIPLLKERILTKLTPAERMILGFQPGNAR